MNRLYAQLARVTTGKLAAWVVLAITVLATSGVMIAGSNLESGGDAPNSLPDDAESAQVAELQKLFPGADVLPAVAIIQRTGGLTAPDFEWAAGVSREWAQLSGNDVSPPIPSEDGEAAIVAINVDADVTGLNLTNLVDELRDVAKAERPNGLNVELTGGAAFTADISSAFEGADFRLLAVTAMVVAILLIVTYRSPVLWLVPLAVIAIADRTAAVSAELVADLMGKSLDGSTAGITSVLVFGAGTNYALLLVSRYREEQRQREDHRDALSAAVRGSAEAILASNLTVVLALLLLVFSVAPNSQSLGISAAVGLLVALAFALFALPAALSLCGRRIFWPFVPKFGEGEKSRQGIWFRIANGVVKHPVRILLISALILGALASGLIGVKVGLSQTEQFRVEAESVSGLETLSAHFPAGAADPVTIIVPGSEAPQALAALELIPGVDTARPSGEHDDLVRITATLTDPPASPESIETIESMRSDLGRFGALVGGSIAKDLDGRAGAERDLKVIIPLILLVVVLVLFAVLRSFVTPLVLITINIISTFAALGLGVLVSTHIFKFPALDISTPIYAFLFLVALGIDYTVFLVLRAREESVEHGTVGGMVQAVGLTGGVITSAGIVLAAVFAVLGVLPLITLTQVGLIVSLGILLDTFFVRTLVVPAVFALVGDKIWWPSALSKRERD